MFKSWCVPELKLQLSRLCGIIFTLYMLVEVAFPSFCEWMQRFQVAGSLHQPPEAWLCSDPVSAKGSLWERRSQPILGSQGHFCRVFFGWAGASHPSLVEIKSVKALLCSARHVSPKPQGSRRPASGIRPYCRILQCSPGQGQLVFLPGPTGKDAVVGRCWGTCQIMGDCRNLKAATVRAVLLPARGTGFLWVF